jgi:hypothetical protein
MLAWLALATARPLTAQQGPDLVRAEQGRFTVVHSAGDATLARSVLAEATARDTFPWLPRPRERVLIAIAPDRRRFREWIGPGAPEWGAAIAFPGERRIVMQGRNAGSDAGDPMRVLRHELAHLALHEAMGELPPRWFDEGYASVAAGEWDREQVLSTNVALALGGMPSLAGLDSGFHYGSVQADAAYAMAYRAVMEMAALDPARGLSLLFPYWRQTGSLEKALRQAYGLTLAGFENRWQDRTRRRYGALALVTDFSLAALIMVILVGPLYVMRRRRDRRRLEAMVRSEADAERRERESAIEALLQSLPPTSPPARDETS